MNRRTVLALVVSPILLLASCSRDASDKRVIAVIPKGTSHEFWKAIHAGANKAGAERGVEILWKGPSGEGNRDDQIKVVEDVVSRGVAGIVIAPLDDKALAPSLAEAKKMGIPVVVIDSDVAWPDRVSYVATDNEKGGRMAAERLGTLLGGKGKVLMMRYAEGSASTTQRESGFLDELKQKYSAIEIVSDNQYAGSSVESAQKTAENLVGRFPELDGVFCPNESATMGMLRALQDAGRAGKVKFVGFDASAKLLEGMKNGEIHGLVIQNPFAMGEIGVNRILDAIEGKPVDKVIDTGVGVATQENMNEPAMKDLLAPDLDRWLK
jgi:ribose transport system substrate-binding protein